MVPYTLVPGTFQVEAGRAPVELIDDLEVDPQLLDLRRAVQLVVVVEGGARMLELDLGVEDDVVGDLVGRQQDEAAGVETPLPLATGRRILHGAEEDLAIGADAQPRDRRVGKTEEAFVRCGVRGGSRAVVRRDGSCGCRNAGRWRARKGRIRLCRRRRWRA